MAPAPLTVSELNRQVRATIEGSVPLLWVGGEISNLTRAPSGHVYFSLKDAGAQVRCVMFRNRAQRLPWRMENGEQVELQGLATFYEARGDFQLTVETVRQAGLGKRYEAFLRLRERLAAAGLFDDAAKRPPPRFPRRIGVITSPKAAALQDVLTALARRAPHVDIVVYPTLVQGDEAPRQIVAALEAAARRAECDVLLLVRGGGSIEDLWAFNDETVAHAVRACPMPVIAGIGHETDVTIADLAADLRAATPTAAAEFASAGWHAAAAARDDLHAGLAAAMARRLRERTQTIDLLAHRLIHPAQKLAQAHAGLDHLAVCLRAAGERRLGTLERTLNTARLTLVARKPDTARLRARLERVGGALAALSPQATLERGYAIVRAPDGAIVRDAAQIKAQDALQLHFAHGGGTAIVKELFPD